MFKRNFLGLRPDSFGRWVQRSLRQTRLFTTPISVGSASNRIRRSFVVSEFHESGFASNCELSDSDRKLILERMLRALEWDGHPAREPADFS